MGPNKLLRVSADDVLAVRPNWARQQAQDWLNDNWKYIESTLVEAMTNAIEDLMDPEDTEDVQQ